MDDTSLTPQFRDPRWRRSLATRLLAWFDRHARRLPWRESSDLYRIWISEIMLQQTQVATVIPYYERFLSAFPDVQSLADAPEQQVLRLWEGLGYYRRARQLHAAAGHVVRDHGGQFPRTLDEVRALPGIGRYTAGAILSIGLDQRLPILEANTIRVLSRLSAFGGDPISSRGQKLLWSAAERLLPAKRCGTFNQALMELGSEICTPKAPRCDCCPLASLCPTRRLGLQEEIPAAKRPMQYEEVTEAAVVIRRGDRVLLRQCQPGERWAGLWDFPRFAVPAGLNGQLPRHIELQARNLTGLGIGQLEKLATLKHGVTRFRITLEVFTAVAARSRGENSTWVRPADLADYPLSTTGRKIARMLLAKPTRRTRAR